MIMYHSKMSQPTNLTELGSFVFLKMRWDKKTVWSFACFPHGTILRENECIYECTLFLCTLSTLPVCHDLFVIQSTLN